MDITSDIFKWLTFGAKVKYTHSYQDTPSTTIGWGWKFTTGNMISPLLPLYLPDSDKYPEIRMRLQMLLIIRSRQILVVAKRVR